MKRVQITRDPMPYGSVMIVDDLETNIYVAKGLLAPYGLQVCSANSGFAAIEKIKLGQVYDIVFMDHMMPNMDGIEATKIIRGMGYNEPIVALTANAVAGQADIFLGNGFNDFISKPIDIRQLNTVLNKLIRDKQPPEVIEKARRGVKNKNEQKHDKAQPGISEMFAEVFVRDASKSLAALDEILKKHGPVSAEDIRTYVIHVHGMKSALANVGQMELAAVAMKLETAGREGNNGLIALETPGFLASLRKLVNALTPKEEPDDGAVDEDKEYLRGKLLEIKSACEEYDGELADKIILDIKEKSWSDQTKELLRSISQYLLHSDFDEIASAVDEWLG